MTKKEKHVVSTGPEMSRFFFSIDDATKLIEDSIENQNQILTTFQFSIFKV